jgi:hypothetical protein
MRTEACVILSLALCLCGSTVRAEPPVASYIFPAGGQRGQAVSVRVGGLFLHNSCGFEMSGPGVEADKQLRPIKTLWFEGPLLPLPDSQQAEDYPRDLAGKVQIAADAPLGARPWRLSTSQGATPALKFMVGDLPEVVETETDSTPGPVEVKLPVTINGRIFPRENVDVWAFQARRGQAITCEVCAARLGSPLDSRIEVRDPHGARIAENDDYFGADSFLRFTASEDGRYEVRIHDTQFRGGPAYVYRLTITDGPYVDRAYPLGGRRGSTVPFELTGQGLPAEPVRIALPADGPRDYTHRLTIQGKTTNPLVLDVDDLPEYLEAEPNDTPEQAQRVELPAVLNGRVDKPGDVDCWAIPGRKGEALDLDLRARRLGSPLLAVVTVSDATGKQLARAESGDAGRDDPWLRFTPPADGTYIVRVEDRFRDRGSPAHAYRLRIARPNPADSHLKLGTDALTLARGGQAKLRISAETMAAAPIQLEVGGLPAGVTATPATIALNAAAAEITLKADASARIAATQLTVRGTVKVGEQTVTRTAIMPLGPGMMDLDTVLLAVALPTPFKIVAQHDMRWAPRGTMHVRHYRIERNGFDGPLEVSLADRQARHLQGVTGPTLTIPAGTSEFDYSVQLPPWMETGRTCRVCVMAVGVVKDGDGSAHTVSFSSVQPNEQIIVVIEPERLGLTAGKTSVAGAPGQSVALPVQVKRGKNLDGPVKVELVSAAHGISVKAVEIPAGKSEATVTIHFDKEFRVPVHAPLVFRATVMDNGKPVIAEAKVDVR